VGVRGEIDIIMRVIEVMELFKKIGWELQSMEKKKEHQIKKRG
jgi:hypothetical protein